MPRQIHSSVRAEWGWEGNVQKEIARFLESTGWERPRLADTEKREHGHDIETQRWGQRLLIEVKGFPSSTYVAGPSAGETKPTLPNAQARQWYSHALLSVLLMRSKHLKDAVAIGLPDCRTYRGLIERTEYALRRLDVGVILVSEQGDVCWHLAPRLVEGTADAPGRTGVGGRLFSRLGDLITPIRRRWAAQRARRRK